MNEPNLECFDCMAAATGEHNVFRSDCPGCQQRMFAALDREHARSLSASVDPLRADELPASSETEGA